MNYKFALDGNLATLTATPSTIGYKEAEQLTLKKLIIYGLPANSRVAVNMQNDATVTINDSTGAVTINNLNGFAMNTAFTLTLQVTSNAGNPLWILLASGIVVGVILLIGAGIAVYFVVEKIRASKKSSYNEIEE